MGDDRWKQQGFTLHFEVNLIGSVEIIDGLPYAVLPKVCLGERFRFDGGEALVGKATLRTLNEPT